MKIGIDISSAVNQQAGIGRYTYYLVEHLLKMDTQNEYTLFYYYTGEDRKLFEGYPNVVRKATRIPGRLLRLGYLSLSKLHLSADFLVDDVDLFHSPDCVLPPLRVKSIVTIHDLASILFPQYYTAINRSYLKFMVPQSARQAEKIIVDSEATKNDAVNLLKVPTSKIKVIYPGVDKKFRRVEREEIVAIKQRYQLPDKYILFVGTIQPRKNLATLVDAFSLLKRDKDFDWELIVAGPKGWLYRDLFQRIEQLELSRDVIFLDFVPGEDLPALYNGADIFVYPSLYEGFGLPVLEAMACGTPVICSNVSSLPEIVGDAAILVDPYFVEGLSQAIYSLLMDNNKRGELREKGLKRARMFSWEKAASEVLEVYREIYDK
ncbi:MAG: glycosyltransferase family 1 protein [Actinomycetota bacterium]|nr:glycosyltransferase family 1 protein [Actinomycetota bacterium]